MGDCDCRRSHPADKVDLIARYRANMSISGSRGTLSPFDGHELSIRAASEAFDIVWASSRDAR